MPVFRRKHKPPAPSPVPLDSLASPDQGEPTIGYGESPPLKLAPGTVRVAKRAKDRVNGAQSASEAPRADEQPTLDVSEPPKLEPPQDAAEPPAEPEPVEAGEPLTQLNPPGYEHTVFAHIEMPDGPFMLYCSESDDEDGPYDPEMFIEDPDSHISMAANGGLHPIYLRALEQSGNRLLCVDGAGGKWHYEMRVLPDNLLAAEDPFTPPDQYRAYDAEVGGPNGS